MTEHDVQNPDMIINIAIAGFLPTDQHRRDVVLSKVRRVVDTTVKHASRYANLKCGFSEKSPSVHFLTSTPLLIDKGLISALKDSLYPNAKFSCDRESGGDIDISLLCDSVTTLGTENNRFVSGTALIFSWLCDQADFAIIFNDEGSPYMFDFLKHCKNAAVPAVSIDIAVERHMLWTEKSYYDSYDDGKLERYIDTLLGDNDLLQNVKEIQSVLGHKLFWGNLYSKYMKKYKATIDTSKPFTKDTIIDESYNIALLDERAQSARSILLQWFYEFDAVAIQYADKYHASIYLRAVIPLMVTVALAVGFYTETLLGPWQITIPGTQLQLWSIVAGLGFFTHALLNFYVYRLSENSTIKSWHKSFLDNRFIAETLRITVHFIPFGIPVNYLNHIKKYSTKPKQNIKVIQRLRCIIKEVGLPDTNFSKAFLAECLDSLEELVNDQIEYHKSSANRYAKIYSSLKLYGKIVFYIGFIFILFRGCFQLYVSFSKIPGELNGKELQPIIKSFSNMLALLFPAWAGYFSSKLTLCNFEGLYNNDMAMIEGLTSIKQMINDEKQKEHLTYGDLYYLSKDVTSLLLGEISEWYSQINTRTITKL